MIKFVLNLLQNLSRQHGLFKDKGILEKNIAKYSLPYEYEFRESIPKTKIGKIAFNELFFKHRHHSINSNNDSQNSLTSKYTRKFQKRFSIREKKFEQKEISVSSMDDSSMSELKEFIKVKKVPQKTKKEAFDSEKE